MVLRNGHSSWKNDVRIGVSQGSILEPLLFLLYVNDLPSSVKAKAKMFADDTKLCSNISTLADSETLQDDLNKVAVWSKMWLLNFNATQCVVRKIRQSLNYAYTFNGEILEVVEKQKDLGITICENLKTSTHIKYIATKANQRIIIIKTVYKTMIRPVLEYASPAWNPF